MNYFSLAWVGMDGSDSASSWWLWLWEGWAGLDPTIPQNLTNICAVVWSQNAVSEYPAILYPRYGWSYFRLIVMMLIGDRVFGSSQSSNSGQHLDSNKPQSKFRSSSIIEKCFPILVKAFKGISQLCILVVGFRLSTVFYRTDEYHQISNPTSPQSNSLSKFTVEVEFWTISCRWNFGGLFRCRHHGTFPRPRGKSSPDPGSL